MVKQNTQENMARDVINERLISKIKIASAREELSPSQRGRSLKQERIPREAVSFDTYSMSAV